MVELRNFGWNAVTISFVATLLFSLWAAWGLYDQVKKIWGSRSGEAVSNIWFICATALFGATIIYGVSTRSIAVTFSGLARGPLHVPILIGLAKFKDFTKREWSLLGFLTIVLVTMAIVPWKGAFFITISMGVLIPTAMQPFAGK